MDVLETLKSQCKENIQRVRIEDLSIQEFTNKFDKANTPCIITGCVDDDWNWKENWSWKVKENKLGNLLAL